MRIDRFDLNLLLALDTLLEERSVTRSSQRLHIGQSAASSALARLREHFGDELLVKVGRDMKLTPLAQSLVEPVRDTLLRARATIARRPGFDPATAVRRFALCASDYVTTVLLGDVVSRLAAQAPGISLDIRRPPREVGQVFERGIIDLLVMPERYVAPLPHPQARLFDDTQVCMVWRAHGSVGQRVSFEQYMDLGHVAVRFGDERSVAFEEWFLPRHGRERRIKCSVDNFATLPSLVIGTQRVATLHRRLATHFGTHLPLRFVPAPFEMPPLVEMMAWPRHVDGDPGHAWLRGLVLDCAAAMDTA
jgi:DNA-binding transcriptional LysR family regulator